MSGKTSQLAKQAYFVARTIILFFKTNACSPAILAVETDKELGLAKK